MAFKQSELPQNVKEEFDLYDKAKEQAMGLATFLGGFMLPGSAGITYPKDIAKTIPASTQLAASQSRRMMYRGLKSDIQDTLANPTKIEKTLEKLGVNKDFIHRRIIKDYKERIKAVTSMPDSLVARVRQWEPPLRGTDGSWSEFRVTNPVKDKGGAVSITPYSRNQPTSVLHEGFHALHGQALKLYEAARIDPKAMEIWKTIPKTSQEVIKDLTRIHKFHEKWYLNAGRRGAEKYKEFYDVWPAEQLAREAPKKAIGLASELGRRPTMDEYLKTIQPISSRLQKDVTFLNNSFKNLDSEMMKQVGFK